MGYTVQDDDRASTTANLRVWFSNVRLTVAKGLGAQNSPNQSKRYRLLSRLKVDSTGLYSQPCISQAQPLRRLPRRPAHRTLHAASHATQTSPYPHRHCFFSDDDGGEGQKKNATVWSGNTSPPAPPLSRSSKHLASSMWCLRIGYKESPAIPHYNFSLTNHCNSVSASHFLFGYLSGHRSPDLICSPSLPHRRIYARAP